MNKKLSLLNGIKTICIVGLIVIVLSCLTGCDVVDQGLGRLFWMAERYGTSDTGYPKPDPEIDKQLSALDDESIYVIELELYFPEHRFDPGESWTLPPTNGKCVQPFYCWYDDSFTEEEYKAGVPSRWFMVVQAAEPGKSELVFYHNASYDETTEDFDDETTEYQDSQTFVFEVDEDLHMRFIPEESDYEIEPTKGYHPR